MMRGGGILNNELIAQYLNKYHNKSYDVAKLIKYINKVILTIKKNIGWGYSISAFLGGIYNLHPSKLEDFYKDYVNEKN